MNKITFLGAGSSVFAKNVLGDCLQTDCLREYEYALFDIDPVRLEESYRMLSNINRNSNGGKAKTAFTKYIRAHRAELPTDREIKVGYFNSTSSLVRSSGVTLENLIEQWANICRN